MPMILLYAAGTWNLTHTECKKLDTLQLKMYRKIMGSFRLPHESREDYFRRTAAQARAQMRTLGFPTWAEKWKELQWSWAGHAYARMLTDCLAECSGTPTFAFTGSSGKPESVSALALIGGSLLQTGVHGRRCSNKQKNLIPGPGLFGPRFGQEALT